MRTVGYGKAVDMRVRTTGAFAVYASRGGKDVTPRGRKARALLAYLVSNCGSKIAKDRIVAMLWGDRGELQARASLRQVIMENRRALNNGHALFFSDRDHVWLAPDSLIDELVDAETECRDAFEDLDNITPEFDDWLAGERNRRCKARIAALTSKAETLLAEGRPAEAADVINSIQVLDPLDEGAVRLGMKAAFDRGRPAEIAKSYETMAVMLDTVLGVEPSGETRALRDELLDPAVVIDRAAGVKLQTLYEKVERGLNIGAWEYDLITEQLWWSPGTYALFGVPVGSTIRREEILERFDAGSRDHLEAVRDQAIRNGTGFSIEADVFTLEGVKNRLRIDAKVECSDGSPQRIFGIMRLVSCPAY